MNIIRCLFIILTCIYANTFASQTLSSLEQLEWKNRIILINSKNQCDSVSRQLIEKEYQIKDRDIAWFIVCKANKKQVISNYKGEIKPQLLTQINKQYFSNSKSKVILIGKDGGLKYRSENVNLKEINLEIDSMPMRIEEMRSKKKRHNNGAF